MDRFRLIPIAYSIFFVWVLLSCYQIYLIRIGGSILPLTTFLMLGLIPFIKFNQFKDKLYLIYVFLFLLTLIYFFWSREIGMWLYQLFFGFSFIISYCISKRVSNYNKLFFLLKVFIWSCALNAFLVIFFRIFPDVESLFIRLFLGIFKNPDRLSSDALLNVWSVNKSGGVFDNGNTAATLHLICFGIIYMLKNNFKFLSYNFLLILNFLAVLSSGSKSALMILIFLFIFTHFFGFYAVGSASKKIVKFLFIIISFAFIFLLGSYFYDLFLSSDFGLDTMKTSEDRFNLYYLAYDLILKFPFGGLGFGGWQYYIDIYGSYYNVLSNWPPHNSLIESWANTGILGFILSVSIIFIILNRCAIFIKKLDIQQGKGMLIACLGAILMPLGDPQPLLGPVQAAPALGIVCAYCYMALKSNNFVGVNKYE